MPPDKPEWETVCSSPEQLTNRLRVPGGWLYKHFEVTLTEKKYDNYNMKWNDAQPKAVAVVMCFVPEPSTLAPLVVNNTVEGAPV